MPQPLANCSTWASTCVSESLPAAQFPVNYFALGQLEQWYGEEFHHEFARLTGGWVFRACPLALVNDGTAMGCHMAYG